MGFGIQAQPEVHGVEDATKHLRTRLLRSRVRSVNVDRVELYPEGVAEAFGTFTVQRSDGEVVEILFNTMLGAGVEDDPDGYGEGEQRDSPTNHHPRILTRAASRYPTEAKAQGVSGVVRLFTLVRKDGTTVVLGVLARLPHGCTEAAMEAVERWTWEPRVYFGREVDALGVASVTFPPMQP